MTKADRQKVFDKYCGHCAYCGCELVKGWHVDEIEPVVRGFKYRRNENGRILTDEKGNDLKDLFMEFPERMNIDNQNPSCASCNIQKHSMSLEAFRKSIAGFIHSLNNYSNQYKFAKRYGLVQETGNEVKFFFEMFQQPINP